MEYDWPKRPVGVLNVSIAYYLKRNNKSLAKLSAGASVANQSHTKHAHCVFSCNSTYFGADGCCPCMIIIFFFGVSNWVVLVTMPVPFGGNMAMILNTFENLIGEP